MDEKTDFKKPLIYGLYEKPLSGADIEVRSFAVIDHEAPSHHYSVQEWEVVRRMIHTVGDFGILGDVRFSAAAITAAEAALKKGCPLYVDSNMIRNGLSLDRLRSVCPHYRRDYIHCHIADDDVAREAREQGLPRSLFAVRKAKAVLDGGIAVFGNAPVALLELNRFIMEEGLRPALVVAMPVGFVHVIESKEELMSLGVPYITLTGRRGGSPLAVSVIHALCSLAVQPVPRKENDL
ncbi:MAG: precorrin-8X methylmutase [Deltaproteobacteria bacterium]|nr:precorrin-8X methylmutase [Deltaproteobacteria bacterium]